MTESKRRVPESLARELTETVNSLRAGVCTVGVFAAESATEVNRIARCCGFDFVQVGGKRTMEDLDALERPFIRVIHVAPGSRAQTIVDEMKRTDAGLRGTAPMYLLDTYCKGIGGGTGISFDREIAREVSACRSVLVAGGLNPSNVGELVREIHPFGVDVSSGVERDGGKDTRLIRAFIAAVRKAQEEATDADEKTAR
jgi:phosphoribosylanthranilate isomerase